MRIIEGADQIQNYLGDESSLFIADESGVSKVLLPETESDVLEIIRSANEDKTLVTVSGGGTGITGSRVPIHGGIVISTERFNSIVGIDEENRTATFRPGITLTELDSALPSSLIYPPDPTEKSAFLGGTAATNASGARCFLYGPTRDWVEGLRVVLANGDVLNIKRGECAAKDGVLAFESESGEAYSIRIPDYSMPGVKNAAGIYAKQGMDLVDLFIGSEGIFGVFTEVTVKLADRRDFVSDMSFFKEADRALAFVDDVRGLRSSGLMSVEFFDDNSLGFMRDQHPEISEDVKAAVFTEFGEGVLENISASQEKNGACEDWCAMTSADARDLKELRHALPEGVNTYLREHESYKLGTDFAVPAEGFDEMFAQYLAAGNTYKEKHDREGMHHVLFGHMGDYHLHFNFITHTEEERATARAFYSELAAKAVALGGTISAEHGVGKKTIPLEGRDVPYLQLMYGEKGLREIARVKRAFDPNGILNVGNMIPRGFV